MSRVLISGLSLQRSGFAPGLVRVGLVTDKVAMVLLRVLRFSYLKIIPRWLSILTYHVGDEK
jgi:hypothetical protein